MFRFLRRVFIILILLIIVFFVFRLVKPEATSRFVDRVKSIPTTVSSRFHREKKSDIIINWNTTSTSSNFEIENKDNNENDLSIDAPVLYNNEEYNITNSQTNIENKDTSRLDELNREIDKILASWNNQVEWEQNNSENSWDLWWLISELVNDNEIEIIEITWTNQNTEFVVIDVEQPYEPETQNTTNNTTQTNNNTQNNNTTTNTTTTQQCGRCSAWTEWNCLSDQDCEDFVRDFWNINFN